MATLGKTAPVIMCVWKRDVVSWQTFKKSLASDIVYSNHPSDVARCVPLKGLNFVWLYCYSGYSKLLIMVWNQITGSYPANVAWNKYLQIYIAIYSTVRYPYVQNIL